MKKYHIFSILLLIVLIIILLKPKKSQRNFLYSDVPTGKHTVIQSDKGTIVTTTGADCGPTKMCCGVSTVNDGVGWLKCPEGLYDISGKWYDLGHGTHCGDIHKVETDFFGNSNAAECDSNSTQCGCFLNTYL